MLIYGRRLILLKQLTAGRLLSFVMYQKNMLSNMKVLHSPLLLLIVHTSRSFPRLDELFLGYSNSHSLANTAEHTGSGYLSCDAV